MASKKTSWAQLRVGLLALAAMAILAMLVVLMSGENPLFRSSEPLYVFFGDAAALTNGAPVRLNGILVGKVEAVELAQNPQENRVVRVTLGVDEKWFPSIPDDSTAGLAQTSLLSARYVNIKKGTSATPVQPGATLESSVTTELQDFFEKGGDTLTALQSILERVERIVGQIEDGEGNIGKFIRDETLYNNLVLVTEDVRKLMANINNPNSTIGKLINDRELYDDARGTIADLGMTIAKTNMLIDGLNAGEGTLGKLLKDPTLHDETVATIADLRQTLRMVNSGEGTIGKLLTTTELHDRLTGSMTRIDTLLDHINSGEGTLGQLLLNPQLYESLDGTTREIQGMMQDFRANPKKFLTIQLRLW